MNYISFTEQSYNYFRNKWGFKKRILLLLFQVLHFRFVTLGVKV